MFKKSNGWVKVLAIGCLIVLVLFLAIGYVVYKKIKEGAPKMIAQLVEVTAEGMFQEMQIPQDESAKAMEVIKSFSLYKHRRLWF